MGASETEINAIIATTPEYAEACRLFTEKRALSAQIVNLTCEINSLSRISPTAVQLAKTYIHRTTVEFPSGVPQNNSENIYDRNLVNASGGLSNFECPPVFQGELISGKSPAQDCNPKLTLFLASVEGKVAWNKLRALIAEVYENETWAPPLIRLSSMIRLYFLNQWCRLPDENLAQSIYHCPAIGTFSGIDPNNGVLPSPAVLLRFRCLLEQTRMVEEVTTIILEGLTRQGPLVLVGVEH